MKRTLFSIMIAASCLVACDNKDEAKPEIVFGSSDSKVAYRQSTVVPASDTEVAVNLKEIEDSRCPLNVVCITMGSVALSFEISDGSNSTSVKTTFSGDGKNSGVQTFTLGKQNYALKVTEVLPYPETSQSPSVEDYKVGVSVVKL